MNKKDNAECLCIMQVNFTFTVTTTPIPTPIPLLEFQTATWTLFGVSVIGLILISALGITFWRQTR